MYTYLWVNLLSVAVPFAFSFHRRLRFVDAWYAFWPACLFTAGVFIVWDAAFTRLGVWGFNSNYVMGLDLLGLPIEEWLFFICIPYACVFTYHCLKPLSRIAPTARWTRIFTGVLAVSLLLVAALNVARLYTSVTFAAAGVFLLCHLRFVKQDYLGRFYFVYAVLLLPFLIVNGTLTGSFMTEEVVWYDDAENLGLRILQIPVEDLIYGLLLILMNVTIYEARLSKRAFREERRTEKPMAIIDSR